MQWQKSHIVVVKLNIWMDCKMNSISLPISNKKIQWKNYENLSRIVKLQTGPQHWIGNNTPELFLKRLEDVVNWNWNRTFKHLKNIDDIKKVVDVGSGIATFDLTLHHLNKDTEFYLVDKSAIEIPKKATYYSNEHYFYNSWDVLNDSLNSSELDKNKFNLLSNTDEWPSDVDLVISMHSWCWHYPKEYYWPQLLKSLRVRGTLILDVLNVKDKNVVEEISDELGSHPTYDLRYPSDKHPFKDEFTFVNSSHGGYYSWVRSR
jgi:SAM-dependent methyltransferase